MIDKLDMVKRRYEELGRLIAQPEVATNPRSLRELGKERTGLERTVMLYQQYKAATRALEETESLLGDNNIEAEMATLAREEVGGLRQQRDNFLHQIKLSLLVEDPNDSKDVIVEIRGGTGGDEASLFAADLFRMYSRYAQFRRWQVEIIDSSQSEVGGFKELVFEVKGKGAYSHLKYERGVHRVQRVPVTESSGRIHTSTATVAVLPEAKEVEVDINPSDLREEFFHSSGAGGQNVNKVTTAVRLVHIPTGITAVCQDERSQIKNRTKAMAVLRARLFNMEQQKQSRDIEENRRSQVGSGERAEKIRTYNFPQNRVTDHRLGLTFHNLDQIMDGALGELLENLSLKEQAQQLESAFGDSKTG
ncbi:MAG: peptide chain release factor 1 [Dehalococcoidia bacterium]|nr:peptide chain release factor 1 [Dehalococcoidia bacterium]